MGIVTFTNVDPFRLPYRLHFATAMGFRCSLTTVGFKLNDRFCMMMADGVSDTFTMVEEGNDAERHCNSEFLGPDNKYFKIMQIPTGFLVACVTPQTPPELKDLAYKFDFGCFSRLRGCATYEEMLPVLGRKDLY